VTGPWAHDANVMVGDLVKLLAYGWSALRSTSAAAGGQRGYHPSPSGREPAHPSDPPVTRDTAK
jgi:hypothetical protein